MGEGVHMCKQDDSLTPSLAKPDWVSFFALEVDVPEDFLVERDQSPPQERDPLLD